MADSLRSELLAIEGIASAELEGSAEAPLGVRVQLSAGADAKSVGVEVERVLASHGMRSHLPGDEPGEADASDASGTTTTTEIQGPPPPPGAAGSNGDASVLPLRSVMDNPSEAVQPVETPAPMLESVSVEESRAGIAVRVAVAGQTVTRQVGTSPEAMDGAIVSALAQLLEVDAELIAVQRGEAGEAKIITVLLEVAGRGQQVGSSVVVAGEAYAVAHASWKALTAPE